MKKVKAYVKWYSPKRPYPLGLIANLQDFAVEIVEDKIGVGEWAIMRRCWELGIETDATHIIAFDDDVLLCSDFCDTLLKALQYRPDNIVELFGSNADGYLKPMFERAHTQHLPWIDQNVHCCGPAIVMPVAMVREFLLWSDRNLWIQSHQYGDQAIRFFAQTTGRMISCTVPCLVNQDPNFESTIKGTPHNSKIQACYFAADNARAIQWNRDALIVDVGDIRTALWPHQRHFTPGGEVYRRFNLGNA